MYVAILLAFLAAVAVGLFNAFFTAVVEDPVVHRHARLEHPRLRAHALHRPDAEPQLPVPARRAHGPRDGDVSFFKNLGNASLPGKIPEQGLWTIALLLVVFGFLLGRTLFGFRLKAIGGSRPAAEIVRLPVKRYIFLAFVICACMACLAGLLDFSFVGSAGPNDGQTLPLPGVRRGDHRRREPVRRQGKRHRDGHGRAPARRAGQRLRADRRRARSRQQILLGTVTVGAVVIDRFTSSATEP